MPDACKTQALRHVKTLLFVRNNVLQHQIVFIFLRLINKKKDFKMNLWKSSTIGLSKRKQQKFYVDVQQTELFDLYEVVK